MFFSLLDCGSLTGMTLKPHYHLCGNMVLLYATISCFARFQIKPRMTFILDYGFLPEEYQSKLPDTIFLTFSLF